MNEESPGTAGAFLAAAGAAVAPLGPPDALSEALAEAGLAPGLVDAAGDTGRDSMIRASMAEADARYGGPCTIPVLAFEDGKAVTGPLLDEVPPPGHAEELWHA